MTTNFPTGLDSLTNPTSSSSLSNPDHATQHSDVNDAIEALEIKVGINSSTDTSSLDYKVRNPRLVGGAARPLLTGGAYLNGTTGLVLTGLSGNYASAPDSAALSITGDIDIKVKATLTDWTPAAIQMLAGKWNTAGNQASYQLWVNTNGLINFGTSPDGTLASRVLTASSVAPTVADGASKWIRATMDADNGSTQNVVKFYTSDDGSSWTQLGTTQTTAGTRSSFDGTAPLEVGSRNLGSNELLNGTIGRVIIQSAYDTADNTTSLQFDANFETQTADALAFTESSSNAATVTINTTRYTMGFPNVQSYTISTNVIGANVDVFQSFMVTKPIIVDMYGFEVTTAPSSTATIHLAIYEANDDLQPVGSPIGASGAITVATGVTANYYRQITPITLQPGRYLVAYSSDVQFTVRTWRGTADLIHTFGATSIHSSQSRSRTSGALPSNNFWNTKTGSSSGVILYTPIRWRAA